MTNVVTSSHPYHYLPSGIRACISDNNFMTVTFSTNDFKHCLGTTVLELPMLSSFCFFFVSQFFFISF